MCQGPAEKSWKLVRLRAAGRRADLADLSAGEVRVMPRLRIHHKPGRIGPSMGIGRGYYAVLHIPLIDSPEKAVRASIVHDHKAGKLK